MTMRKSWIHAAAHQGMSKMASQRQMLGPHKGVLYSSQRDHGPADLLISDC